MRRRSPRALALWGAAAVTAVVTAAVVAGDLAALHRRAADLGPEVDAVVATRDLPIGHAVASGDVASRSVHRSQLPPDVLTDRAALVGRIVAVPVLDGAYLVRRSVAPRRRNGLDGIVPEGLRAMRVVVTDALTPRRGAAVDVLATYDPSSSGSDGGTILIAAGVTVLGTDRRAGAGSGRTGAAGVTLLVDPDQAAALADAQTNG
ncbi:MAG TPA: Flp pilus assembly protein CpaB, partial [Acidimicrobiia bacterium]|nr:Flp pilus assembly protein CpaB [Acidimicrobiia bacterium]